MTEVTASVNTPNIFSAMTEVWAIEHANEAKQSKRKKKWNQKGRKESKTQTQNEDNNNNRLDNSNKVSALIWLEEEEEEKEVNQGSRVEAEHPLLIYEQFELQQEELFKMVLIQRQLHRQE